MTFTIKFRRGNAAEWTGDNPLLKAGEPGAELDTGKLKIGDGIKRWNELGYLAGEGAPGDSAYEVAINNGFVGTESQWLASLVGPAGTNGPNGTNGTNGTNGSNGASAYQVAVANGFVGNEAAWLASLVGAPGTNGTNGTNGADGTDGVDGESVTVTLVPAASWPPASDSNPLHLYFRVP